MLLIGPSHLPLLMVSDFGGELRLGNSPINGKTQEGKLKQQRTRRWSALGMAFGLAGAVASATGAYAQTANEQTEDEIVVTAQRRAQNINDVPFGVTAFDAEILEQAAVSEAKEYLSMTPNVSFQEDGETGNRGVSISIRGVSDVDLGEVSVANSVGYYIDELSVASVANGVINPQLLDMERIEVLRGPQGTYFGRNSSAGALNITTVLPHSNPALSIEASAGSFGTQGVNAIANLPVSDSVFLRFAGAVEASDGIVRNINPLGTPDSGFDYSHLRGAVRVLLNENATLDVSLTRTEEDEGADATVPTGVLDLDTQSIFGSTFVPVNTTGFYPNNIRRFDHDADEYNTKEFTIANVRFEYDFGGVTLRSITGQTESENDRFFDQDNIFADTIVRENHYEGSSFSQELRLQSDTDGPLQWTIGAIFAKDEIDQFNSIRAGGTGSILHPNTGLVTGLLPPIPAGFRINENNRAFATESTAIFADAKWELTDQLSVALGGRYTQDEVEFRVFDTVAFEGAVPDAAGEASFDDFSPRLSALYELSPEVNAYATISRGYKAGGIDFPGGVANPFDPESLWNYEVGLKGYLFDRRLRFDVAAFLIDWTDLQVQSNFLLIPGDISSGVELTQNAESAENMGLEATIDWELTDDLTFQGGFGYLDSEFGSFADARIKGGFIVDFTGERLPATPEWTWNAALTYRRPVLTGFDGWVRLEAFGRTESRSDLEAVAQLADPSLGLPEFPYLVPGFSVVNLRVGVDHENFSLNAFVENLLEENYYTSTSENFGLSGMRVRPHPQTAGVRLRVKYGE